MECREDRWLSKILENLHAHKIENKKSKPANLLPPKNKRTIRSKMELFSFSSTETIVVALLIATSCTTPFKVDGFATTVTTSYMNGLPPPTKEGVVWTNDACTKDVTDVLSRAFAGTGDATGEPVCDWIKSHMNDKEWYTQEQHQQTVKFALGVGIDDVYKQKPLIISKRNTNNGELVSAAIISEYDKSYESTLRRKLLKEWREWKAFVKYGFLTGDGGLPDLFAKKQYKQDAKHLRKKMEFAMQSLHKWHATYGPTENHWYVTMVGVHPNYKGCGYGGDLMNKISALADEAGIMCYLECGASNVPFYEKMGYKVLSKHTLCDPEDTSREPCEMYVLTRDPVVSKKD